MLLDGSELDARVSIGLLLKTLSLLFRLKSGDGLFLKTLLDKLVPTSTLVLLD
jgi:hypothetical protein